MSEELIQPPGEASELPELNSEPIFSKESIVEKTHDSLTSTKTFDSRAGFTFGDEIGESEQELIAEEPEIDWELYPYGPDYEEITHRHLKAIAYELGLITLCWPEDQLNYENRKHFPRSYSENTKKEKLFLLFAENFRRQYNYLFPDRKPLLLAPENECGIQKMVCTTIRPTTLDYPEFYAWEGCSQFVADHIVFEPLQKITLLPERLCSPRTVLANQSAHSFEFSTILCSYLVAACYDAYVVSGYASREMCTNDRSRFECPFLDDEEEVETEAATDAEPKYLIKPPKNLHSKFLYEMEMREVRKVQEAERLAQEEERREREAYEQPQSDDFFGLRLHSWVLVLPGGRDVTEPFFIEPASGKRYETSFSHYFGIESVWNHTNYWVNLQLASDSCKNIKFDLLDLKCWEHILPGEPWQTRKTVERTDEENELILQEKHLDVPASWVERLAIANKDYENRFPNGSKVTPFRKALVEQFAPYVLRDGLVTRVTTYADLNLDFPEVTKEYYSNRADSMLKITKNLKTEIFVENFKRGREDAVKNHTYILSATSVESERTFEFFHEARLDGLEKLLMHPLYLTEHYRNRDDLLYYRHAEFAPRTNKPNEINLKRNVVRLTERYHRDPKKKASVDIAQRVFAVADNEILIKYHYEEGRVTAQTREFIKPPATELGDRLTYNPELSCGFQVDPMGPAPRELYLFLLLDELLKAEEVSLSLVRDMEDEVAIILRNRAMETTISKLIISIFDKERNGEAKEGLLEREELLRAKKMRETLNEIDYLGPYVARIGSPTCLTQKQAVELRDECLSDFKELLVDRANRLQARFEAEHFVLQAKHAWYEKVQDSLTREEEEAYFEYTNKSTFFLHTLELRLNRQRDLAHGRYLAVEAALRADKRLAILQW